MFSPIRHEAMLRVHAERIATATDRGRRHAGRSVAPGRRRLGRRVRVELWLPLPARDAP